MRQTIRLYLLLIVFMSPLASAGDAVFQTDGVAIRGFDPVSYHTMQKASKGDSQHSYQWNNTTWHFSNPSNKNLFSSNPEKYAPQYGGFCAYAASKGSLAPIDPQAWTLRNDKLYLNYSKSVRTTWKKDVDKNIKLADENWPQLRNQ